MKKIAVMDIEATNWTEFACLGFFDGEYYSVFWGVESFLDFFLQKRFKGWTCYAHFGGGYDFRFLIPALVDQFGYDVKIIERNSRILSLKVVDTKRKLSWNFSDSYFLLPMSLKVLGESFGVKHVKREFDVENTKDFSTPEAQAYLKDDCFSLYEILEKFSVWGLNGGKLKRTLPSQSLFIFSSQYLKNKKLYELDDKEEAFIRQCYFGGRVEIFRTYGEHLKYYDFSGHYPKQMLEDMPCGRCLPVSDVVDGKIGFYKIKTYIPEDLLISPLCVSHDFKLFFPVGEGEFFVTSADIELLRKLDIDFKVINGLVFESKQPLFKQYILDMWNIRRKSQPGTMDNVCSKLFMNSLYGKFGQKRSNIDLIFSKFPKVNYVPFDEDFGLYYVEKETKSRFILPYLSAYITSLARVKLYELFLMAGVDNCFYCDTDSIITDKILPTGYELGDLKLEYNISEAVFLQPKAYALKLIDGKEVIKLKGFSLKKDETEITFDLFKQALEKNDLSIINKKYYKLMGFRETLKREKNLYLKRVEYSKQLNNIYDKRILLKNYLTSPIIFSNI